MEVVGPVTLVEFRESEIPVELETLKATMALKPFSEFRLIVEVACPPAVIVRLVGLAESEKSSKDRTAVAMCDSAPLAPVTVRV